MPSIKSDGHPYPSGHPGHGTLDREAREVDYRVGIFLIVAVFGTLGVAGYAFVQAAIKFIELVSR